MRGTGTRMHVRTHTHVRTFSCELATYTHAGGQKEEDLCGEKRRGEGVSGAEGKSFSCIARAQARAVRASPSSRPRGCASTCPDVIA